MICTIYNATDNSEINELIQKAKEKFNENISSSPHKGYSYDCCKNCPNNPMNNPNASGICHCTLPSMEMIRF